MNLYHYTTQGGLRGIAQSQSLWATNIRYLNDATEYLHAVHIAQRVMNELDVTNTERKFIGHLLGGSVPNDSVVKQNGTAYFVVSLTENPDKLSQWRAYAGRGGYCVGWMRSLLERLGNKQGFSLSECEYNDDAQVKLIRPILVEALDRWRAEPLAVDFDNLQGGSRSAAEIAAYMKLLAIEADFERDFGRVAAVCKNGAFSEEEEWRLVKVAYLADGIEFREGKSMLIPYVRFKFDFKETAGQENQTELYVGPHAEQDLALRSAALALLGNEWPSVLVEKSKVPHRDW
jgi:hypothetical protein